MCDLPAFPRRPVFAGAAFCPLCRFVSTFEKRGFPGFCVIFRLFRAALRFAGSPAYADRSSHAAFPCRPAFCGLPAHADRSSHAAFPHRSCWLNLPLMWTDSLMRLPQRLCILWGRPLFVRTSGVPAEPKARPPKRKRETERGEILPARKNLVKSQKKGGAGRLPVSRRCYTPWASMASTTFSKPAMLAPIT